MSHSKSHFQPNNLLHKAPFMCALSVVSTVLASTVVANTAAASALAIEEVIVTAERREANLQQVPLAVSSFSKSDLEAHQAETIGDLQALVPNLSVHVGDANNAVVYIRGVGQIDSIAFFEPGVGIYLDDVYLGRAQGAFLDVVDVERIEVLRGPQGSLYGRNSVGGAIKYVSSKPTNELSANLSATVGRYDQLDIKASFSGPLIEDKLLGRLTMAQLGRDGYSDNLFDGSDDGDRNTQFVRAVVEAHPSDNILVELSADYTNTDPDHSRTPAKVTPTTVTVVDPYSSGLSTVDFTADSDPFKVNADFNTTEKTEVLGFNATVSWDINDSWSFKSISSYREVDYGTELDLDGTPINSFGIFYFNDQEQTSQEFQLSYNSETVSAVTGLYYFNEEGDTYDGAILSNYLAAVTGEAFTSTDSYAAFGQVDYHISERITATFGFRYTDEEKDYHRQNEDFDLTALAGLSLDPETFAVGYSNPELLNPSSADLRLGGGIGVPQNRVDPDAESFANFSPKLGLKWQHSEDFQVYGNISRGFKSGGFNGRTSDGQTEPYDEETLTSYEIGFKSQWLDNLIRLNAAVFHNDYEDLQVSSFEASPSGSGLVGIFTNAGEASIQGFEIEFTARVSEALTLNTNLGYLNAKYDEFISGDLTTGGLIDISGDRELVNAPEIDAFMGVVYDIPLESGSLLTLMGDISYRSKTYLEVNSSENLAQAGYSMVNASINYASADDHWRIALWGKNLSDKQYRTHAFDLSEFPGVELGYYNPPRTYGVTVYYSL